MIKRHWLSRKLIHDYESYKDLVAYLPDKMPVVLGTLKLKHFRTPPEYVARLIGYDPVAVFQRQFIKPTKIIFSKARYKCGQRKRSHTTYQFPLPDGVYEIQQRGTRAFKKKFPWDYAQRVYIEFLDGNLAIITNKDAKKKIQGSFYVEEEKNH